MTTNDGSNTLPIREQHDLPSEAEKVRDTKPNRWKRLLGRTKATEALPDSRASSDGFEDVKVRPEKWSLGVLNDKETEEVPGMASQSRSLGD